MSIKEEKRYTTAEVCELTGITRVRLKSLTKKHPRAQGDVAFFCPEWPAVRRGSIDNYSDGDVELLLRYRHSKEAHQEILREMRRTLSRRPKLNTWGVPQE